LKAVFATNIYQREGILFANLDFKKYLWSLYNADTGYVEPLDDDVEIVVPEDDHGLYAIDVLDPSWVSSRVFGSMED